MATKGEEKRQSLSSATTSPESAIPTNGKRRGKSFQLKSAKEVTALSDASRSGGGTNLKSPGKISSSRKNLDSVENVDTYGTGLGKKSSPSFNRPSNTAKQIGTGDRRSENLRFQQLDPIGVDRKLQRRFYESLVMAWVLGKNRGDRILDGDEHHNDLEPFELSKHKARRSFIRNLAYLCDYEKGGDRTTAIAIQQTPQELVYWLASNKSPSVGGDRTKDFLAYILGKLKFLREEDLPSVEGKLFQEAVAFSRSRIQEYCTMLSKELDFVLTDENASGLNEDASLTLWLQKLQHATSKPEMICEVCFELRDSQECRSLQFKARDGARCASRFGQIRHIIGRLNHTMKAVKTVVAAALRLPQLFDDFSVMREESSQKSMPPLQMPYPTLSKIVGRMVPDATALVNARAGLEELDQKFELSESFAEKCASRKWRPRVHAELLILDKFWRLKFDFVDGDRYIGTSKPACYACYHYMMAHPLGLNDLTTHNNVYPNWKVPDVYVADNHVIETRTKILNGMKSKIAANVLAQLAEKRAPARWRPDSLTEISTVRHDAIASSENEQVSDDSLSNDESSDEIEGTSSNGSVGIFQQDNTETEDEDECGGVSLL